MRVSLLKRTFVGLTTIGLLLGSLAAHAGIVYQVDRSFGAGTLVGTIATNGNLGLLEDTDIVSFSFD